MSINVSKDEAGNVITRKTQIFCPFCLERKPESIEFSIGTLDEDTEPCETCKQLMETGVMICETADGESEKENPIRTGRMITVTKEWFFESFKDLDKDTFFWYMDKSLFAPIFDEALKEDEDANEQEKPE